MKECINPSRWGDSFKGHVLVEAIISIFFFVFTASFTANFYLVCVIAARNKSENMRFLHIRWVV